MRIRILHPAPPRPAPRLKRLLEIPHPVEFWVLGTAASSKYRFSGAEDGSRKYGYEIRYRDIAIGLSNCNDGGIAFGMILPPRQD